MLGKMLCQSQGISINQRSRCLWCQIQIHQSNSQGACIHDSTMIKTNVFGRKCAAGAYGDGFVLGDNGYGCTQYLLTPYNARQSPSEVRFKRAHKTTRCTIERAFGILKRRFHCLHTELRLQPGPPCRSMPSKWPSVWWWRRNATSNCWSCNGGKYASFAAKRVWKTRQHLS